MWKAECPVQRSFAPTSWLVKSRDVNALWYKYRAKLPEGSRRGSIFKHNHHAHGEGQRMGERLFGSVSVDLWSGLEVELGIEDQELWIGGNEATVLHIEPFKGLQQGRKDLRHVAEYITRNLDLAERKFVVGVTYKELGDLAVRLGFREAEIFEWYEDTDKFEVQTSHMVFCALNPSKKPRPFVPMAVYLPTEEFCKTFAGPPTI